jgi:hypothetical protein
MKALRKAAKNELAPSPPSEIHMAFNSNSPFEVYARHCYTFKVTDQENQPGSVFYEWKVANGKILEGQGKTSVKVCFGEINGALISVRAVSNSGQQSKCIDKYVKIHTSR